MNDASFEMRLAALESTARRYRLAFFAAVVLAVGMGAKFAVMDAEFNIVKAGSFEVVAPDGTTVAALTVGESRDTKEVEGYLMVANDKATRTTTLSPGKKELTIRNK